MSKETNNNDNMPQQKRRKSTSSSIDFLLNNEESTAPDSSEFPFNFSAQSQAAPTAQSAPNAAPQPRITLPPPSTNPTFRSSSPYNSSSPSPTSSPSVSARTSPSPDRSSALVLALPTPNSANSADGEGVITSVKKPKVRKELLIDEKYLTMRQSDAAFQLGFAPSTFSKRWRNSMPNRKWPFRKHSKLENSIKSLKAWQKRGHNVTDNLEQLYRERAENVTAAVMYYYEKDIVIPGVGVDDPNNNLNNPHNTVEGSAPALLLTLPSSDTHTTTTTTTASSPSSSSTTPNTKPGTTGKQRKRYLPEDRA